jgi:geranylgeranyl pyrophosphate synthase
MINTIKQTVVDYTAEHHLVPPLSMEELREHAARIDSDQLDYTMVMLNNEVWRETIASIPYERRLLLLPQCLRHPQECEGEMDEFGLLCAECGKCCIAELQALAETLGYVVLVAEGTTVVSKLLIGGKIDAVVGVSCLSALEKSFPHMADGAIPGIAIPLSIDGCIGTKVDIDAVRAAIQLKSSNPWKNRLDTDHLHTLVDTWFAEPPKVTPELRAYSPVGPAVQNRVAGPTPNTAEFRHNCLPDPYGDSALTQTEQIATDWLLKDGKRWRPYLLACTYSALKEGTTDLPDDVRRLAISVECFHKASLVHDDIEDDDDLRYGQPTLHKQVGIPVAINAGDLLVGEGYRWITTVEKNTAQLLRIAAENHRTLCLGQGDELFGLAQKQTFTTEQIIKIFRRKTAPAFGVALQLGAVAAGADAGLLETLQSFSESLGIAYQIHDDLEEYKSGEASDLRASILLALANDTHPGGNPPFEELMVVEKAEQLLEHYKNEAIRALNPVQNSLLKSFLRRITAKMLTS